MGLGVGLIPRMKPGRGSGVESHAVGATPGGGAGAGEGFVVLVAPPEVEGRELCKRGDMSKSLRW
jgi:hypothetical protein